MLACDLARGIGIALRGRAHPSWLQQTAAFGRLDEYVRAN